MLRIPTCFPNLCHSMYSSVHTHQVEHFNLTPRHSCITEGICHYGINLTRDLWLKFYLSDSSLYKLASVQFISLIPFQVPIYNLFIVQKEWRSGWNPEPTRTKIVCQIFFNLIVLSTDAYSDNLKTLFTFFFFQNHFQDGILTWLVLVLSALLQPSHSPLLG